MDNDIIRIYKELTSKTNTVSFIDRQLLFLEKPLEKIRNSKIKLYHGTCYDIKSKVLSPIGINVGATRYSTPRWSTFFWDDRELSEKWALCWTLASVGYKVAYIGQDKKVLICDDGADKLKDTIIGKKLSAFIYECDVSACDIEIGSSPSIKEYTVSKPVEISKKHKVFLNKSLFDKYFKITDESTFNKEMDSMEYKKYDGVRKSKLLNLILNDYRDDYRAFIDGAIRNGHIHKGGDISKFRKVINRGLDNDVFNKKKINDSYQISESVNNMRGDSMNAKKNPNLLYIEECIGNIQDGGDKKKNLDTIRRFINRMYSSNANCLNITICDNEGMLFGMNVVPVMSAINRIYSDMAEGKVSSIKGMDYNIEIDSKLLFDKSLNMNPGEITSVLLHEIGHMVMDTSFLKDVNMLFIENLSKQDININKNRNLEIVLSLYIFNFIEKTRITNRVKNFEVEISADDFSIKQGYGKELYMALDKFASYYNTTIKKVKSKSQIEKEYEEDAMVYADLVKNFNNRQAFLLKTLKKEEKFIYSKIFLAKIKENMKLIDENIMNVTRGNNRTKILSLKNETKLSESMVTKMFGLTPKVTQKTVDELSIESQMMETNDDKLILVGKIHKKIADVDEALTKVDTKKEVGNLKSYRNQLVKLLQFVINKKIQDKTYGVFVKYPVGYEG